MEVRRSASLIARIGVVVLCGCQGLGLPEALPDGGELDQGAQIPPMDTSHRPRGGGDRDDADGGTRPDEVSPSEEADAGRDELPDELDPGDDGNEPARAGSTCESRIELAEGSSQHSLHFERHALRGWYSVTLPPRRALYLGVISDNGAGIVLFGSQDGSCERLYDFGPEVQVEPNSSSSLSAVNDSALPVELLIWIHAWHQATLISLDVELRDSCAGLDCDSRCGDGQLTGSEQCDDANLDAGDGCGPACTREPGFSCVGEPSVCAAALPGDLCEQAETLSDGEFTLAGYDGEPTCGVEACAGASRWWVVDVPAGHVLWVGLHSDELLDGELVLWPYDRSSCDAFNPRPLARLPFGSATGRLQAAHGIAWRAFVSERVAVQVADLTHNRSTLGFSLKHQLSASGCGDGIRDPGFHIHHCHDEQQVCHQDAERCDDANTLDGDGCSGSCTIETGWDCGGGPCVLPDCGDGVVHYSEECDDGGHLAGDGCSADCHYEPGYLCPPNPQPCALAQPGDACSSAELLVDGEYSWTGYLADNHCTLWTDGEHGGPPHCNGVDRWFYVTVPAGHTLLVNADSDSVSGYVELIDIEDGCRGGAGWSESLSTFGSRTGRAVHFNRGTTDRRVAVAFSLEPSEPAEGGFNFTHSIAPTGCGDGYLHGGSGNEACDDGNTLDADGCSASCTIE